MTRYDAVNYISHGISKRSGVSDDLTQDKLHDQEEVAQPESEERNKKKIDALTAYCVNLNEKAKAGKIDRLVGRESEVNRTI